MTRILTEIQPTRRFSAATSFQEQLKIKECLCKSAIKSQVVDILPSSLFLKENNAFIGEFLPKVYSNISSFVESQRANTVSDFTETNNIDKSKFLEILNQPLGDESLFCHWLNKIMALNVYYGGEIKSPSFIYNPVEENIIFNVSPSLENQNEKCSDCNQLKFRIGHLVSQDRGDLFMEPLSLEVALGILFKLIEKFDSSVIAEDCRRNMDESSYSVLLHWKDMYLGGRIAESPDKKVKNSNEQSQRLSSGFYEYNIPNEENFERIQTRFGIVYDLDPESCTPTESLSNFQQLIQKAYQETLTELLASGRLIKYSGDLETISSRIISRWEKKAIL